MEVVERTVSASNPVTGGGTTWVSPFSGITYELRMLSDLDFTAELKAVAVLTGGNGATSPSDIEKGANFRRALVGRAVVSCDAPGFQEQGAGALPYPDTNAIHNWVQYGVKLAGPQAEAARGLL